MFDLVKNGLYCIELPDEMSVGGDWFSSDDVNELAIIFSPCSQSESPDCISDFEQQKEYLGNSIQFYWYSNYERLDKQSYGDNAIKKESKVQTMTLDVLRPSYIEARISSTELTDETDLV